jgi:hypothetical protein
MFVDHFMQHEQQPEYEGYVPYEWQSYVTGEKKVIKVELQKGSIVGLQYQQRSFSEPHILTVRIDPLKPPRMLTYVPN